MFLEYSPKVSPCGFPQLSEAPPSSEHLPVFYVYTCLPCQAIMRAANGGIFQ